MPGTSSCIYKIYFILLFYNKMNIYTKLIKNIINQLFVYIYILLI